MYPKYPRGQPTGIFRTCKVLWGAVCGDVEGITPIARVDLGIKNALWSTQQTWMGRWRRRRQMGRKHNIGWLGVGNQLRTCFALGNQAVFARRITLTSKWLVCSNVRAAEEAALETEYCLQSVRTAVAAARFLETVDFRGYS